MGKINRLIWKNRLRLSIGTIRYWGQGLLIVIVVVATVLYRTFFAILGAGIGTAITERNAICVLIGVSIFQFAQIFLSQNPVFKLNAATILYTYNTTYFQRSLYQKRILSVAKWTGLSFFLAFCMGGFMITSEVVQRFVFLLLYNHCSNLLSWIYYHEKKKLFVIALLFVGITALLMLQNIVAIIILALILLLLEVYVGHFIKLNIPKYYERMQFIDTVTAVQSQNNLGKMQQLANDNRPTTVRSHVFRFLPVSKRTALPVKCIIEIVRMQKQELILLFMFLFAGWVISKTAMFDFFPTLETLSAKNALGAFCTMLSLNTLYALTSDRVKTICDKRLLGLSLPFSTKRILTSYALVMVALNLIISTFLGILYSKFSPVLLIFWIIIDIAYVVQSCLTVYDVKTKDLFVSLTVLLLWAVTYWTCF